ncbi:MAG: WYL domain-containing protein [Alphaproteobacteria bacterium]|nr:WYL domain-containing protein [Alphaproteobacteria bacterium]
MSDSPFADETPAPPRWSIERRLAFIGERLAWDRRINRADLVQRFGISPNQATQDLRRFEEAHPGALAYDQRGRTYRALPAWTRPDAADADALLRELRLIAEGVMPAADGRLEPPPQVEIADAPLRPVAPDVLRAVIDAIRHRRAFAAGYRSFSTPGVTRRVLEPHSLLFDGFRWHARAHDVARARFGDFVLGRLGAIMPGDAARTGSGDDAEWQRRETLVIVPHPGLTEAQREAVAIDYGMQDGRLVLEPRAAVSFYVKKRLGLTEGHHNRPPTEQHVVLLASERSSAEKPL